MGSVSRLALSLSAAALCVALFPHAFGQGAPAESGYPISRTRSLGKPLAFNNLTLVPVYDSAASPGAGYMTLDEGLKSKAVKVEEAPSGGDVNTLYISNRGSKALYVMAGEVVLGGQQDRCLGKDLIVAAGKRRVPIGVFCVEHGRWTGSSSFGASANAVASAEIRSDVQDTGFVAASPTARQSAGRSGRVTTLETDPSVTASASIDQAQGKVWDKVAKKNAAFNASPSTGTYREILNMSGGDARKTVAPYTKALSQVGEGNPHIVGVVAAVNGKVVSADIFGDPVLFHKLWPKLLNSYSADAAENQSAAGKRVPGVTQKQAKEFLTSAQTAGSRVTRSSGTGVSERYETKTAVTYKLLPHAAAGGPGGGSGGSGATPLHENVLGKQN